MQNPWSFGRDVVAQALGTVIGGGILFLIGKLSGVIGRQAAMIATIALLVSGEPRARLHSRRVGRGEPVLAE